MDTILLKEINEEYESLELTESYNRDNIIKFVHKIKERGITNVVIAARGSSDHVGVYFKYLFEQFAHIPVGLAGMSVVTKYKSYINYNHTLVLAISQSGSGVDITDYVKSASEHGATTLSITNNLDGIVTKACEMNLFLNLPNEQSLAATKTFISQMYLALSLVATYTNNERLLKACKQVKYNVKNVIGDADNIRSNVDFFKGIPDCYMLGRGIDLVSAFESALKIQETTYIKGKAYPTSDFYHGPFAIADEDQNFVVFCSKGECYDDALEMINKLLDIKAKVLVITNDKNLKVPTQTIYHEECDEVIAPFANIITIQILVNFIAIDKGMNPDHPRNLKKVTITR